ncbi:MAG: hypothetical protein NXH85_07490 [Pseudomonadaceae bacterium]|nr:hypothetical protein [Pseudomonadaceae bacterium]
MPWQFVEMYGQSNVADYVIERALTAHSQLLLACSAAAHPKSRRATMTSDSQDAKATLDERAERERPMLARICATRQVVAACWWTLSEGIDPEVVATAKDRDAQLAEVLTGLQVLPASADLLADIHDATVKAKTRSALSRVLERYRSNPATAAGANSGHPDAPGDEELTDLAVAWSESDAAAWRDINGVSGVTVDGGVFASDSLLHAFDRGAFRAQRWLAKPKRKHARKLLKHARRLGWQLALLRETLGEQNRALAWYTDKLVAELEVLGTIDEVLHSDAVTREEGKDALRVRSALDARSAQVSERIEKLIARVYGQSRGELATRLEDEIAALDVDRQIVLAALNAT